MLSFLDRRANAARLVQYRGASIPAAPWNDMPELEQRYWRDLATAVLNAGAEAMTAFSDPPNTLFAPSALEGDDPVLPKRRQPRSLRLR